MRWLEKKIDQFCLSHPRFGIPNLMLYIAIGNIAIYLLDTFSLGIPISNYLYFSRDAILHGQVWRLFTFIFLPQSGDYLFKGTGLFFVAISAYFYFLIGSLMEREMGTARFTLFYLSGVLLNIVCGMVTGYNASMYYIDLSLFFSLAVLFPDTWIRLFFFLPVKLKWIAWIDGALFIWSIVSSLLVWDLVGAFLPIVATLNFIIFFWSYFVEWANYRKLRFQHQHASQTLNFKKATSKAYQEKGYVHKCAVCGKTDTEYPDMEFRYCSKCNGYYCYCMDHINNHTHIQ